MNAKLADIIARNGGKLPRLAGGGEAFHSAIPVPETQVGIAKEAARGTPKEPEFWLPVMSPKYKPDLTLMPDEGLRGSMVKIYDEIPGLRFDSHGWDSYPYMDTLPVLVRALLGSADTKTAAEAETETQIAAAAGSESIETKAEIKAGAYIVIGAGVGSSETRLVKEVKKESAEHYKITLAYPLSFAHPEKTKVIGLTKHEFSLLNNDDAEGNQPPSYTLTDFGGETNWRQLPAGQLDTLTFTGSADALPKVATNWFANASVPPGGTPSPSFSTAEAPPGWTLTAAIGGTQIGYVVDWETELKRGVKPVPAITGTQNYYQLFASALEATAKLTVLEDFNATWLTAYETGELVSLDLTLSDVESGWALNLHSSKAKFLTGDLDRSKEWVEVPLEMQLIPSSEDALAGGVSPIKVTVANAHTAVY